MTLPDHLRAVLPQATARAWERLAPAVPSCTYLAGGTAVAVHLGHRESRDLDFFLSARVDWPALRASVSAAGEFLATAVGDEDLEGYLDDAKVQFLAAESQVVLEPLVEVAGIRVAGIGDLLAMKLEVLTRRGALRDYFDLMSIEQQAGRMAEEGLGLVLARYRPVVSHGAIAPIVRALGYLGDVADDPQLPASRQEIERYWRRRQREIVRYVDRYG